MNINDKTTFKKIILILLIGAIFLWCAINYTIAITLIFNVLSLFTPLLIGVCMAFVFNVVLKLFENRIFMHISKKSNPKKLSGRIWLSAVRPLSLILTLIIIFGIVILVIALIIPELRNSLKLLTKEFPIYIDYTQVWLNDTLASLGFGEMKISLPDIDWRKILRNIGDFLSVDNSDLISNVASFTSGVFGVVTNMVIGFIFSLYMLLQKEKLARQIKGVTYALLSKGKADALFGVGRLSNEIFGKFITGQFLEAIIIGTLCYIGMKLLSLTAVFEFPYAMMISVLIGFTALIPVIGAFIGTLVGAILILMQDPIQAVWFVLFILVLQQLESNLIYPRVIGKSIGLPGIWVMFSVIAGGMVYGIIGVIIGVPLCSVLYVVLKNWVIARLDKKKINIDKVEARNLRDSNEYGTDRQHDE